MERLLLRVKRTWHRRGRGPFRSQCQAQLRTPSILCIRSPLSFASDPSKGGAEIEPWIQAATTFADAARGQARCIRSDGAVVAFVTFGAIMTGQIWLADRSICRQRAARIFPHYERGVSNHGFSCVHSPRNDLVRLLRLCGFCVNCSSGRAFCCSCHRSHPQAIKITAAVRDS